MIGNLEVRQNGKLLETQAYRPCIIFAALLMLLILPTFIGMGLGGIDSQQYWGSQVNWFLYINQQISDYPTFWHNSTQLGNALILLPLLSLIAVYRPITWAAIFGSIPVATILTHGGKSLASVPRPAAVLDHSSFTIIGDALKGSNSLPSGHTVTVFVAGTVLMLALIFAQRTRTRWLVLSTIVAVTTTLGISRIAVGAHWPMDIMFGAACGYLGGLSGFFFTQRYTRWWSWIKQPTGQLVQGIILITWSLLLIITSIGEPAHMLISTWSAALVGLFTASILLFQLYTRKLLTKPVFISPNTQA